MVPGDQPSSFHVTLNMVSTQILQANTPAITLAVLDRTWWDQHTPGKGSSICFPATNPYHRRPPATAKCNCHLRSEGLMLPPCTMAQSGEVQKDLAEALGMLSPDSPWAEGTGECSPYSSDSDQEPEMAALCWLCQALAQWLPHSPSLTKPQLQELPERRSQARGKGWQLRGQVTVAHCWL